MTYRTLYFMLFRAIEDALDAMDRQQVILGKH
jgi:hypothetical protein